MDEMDAMEAMDGSTEMRSCIVMLPALQGGSTESVASVVGTCTGISDGMYRCVYRVHVSRWSLHGQYMINTWSTPDRHLMDTL